MSFNIILQDHLGFIWLGSTNGLYRYDGTTLRAFKKYGTGADGLSSDWVWDLAEDAAGDIWIATYSGGLNRWQRKSGKISHYTHAPSDTGTLSGMMVADLHFDRRGNLWLATRSQEGRMVLDRMDPSTGMVTRYSSRQVFSGREVFLPGTTGTNHTSILSGAGGYLWIATTDGLLRYDPAADTFSEVPLGAGELDLPLIVNIYPSPQDSTLLWISAAGRDFRAGAIYRVNTQTLESREVFRTDGENDYAPAGLWQPEDRPDELWFSSRSLSRLRPSSGERIIFPVGRPEAAGGKAPSFDPFPLLTIHGDQNGRLWLIPLGMAPGRQVRGADNYMGVTPISVFDPGNGRFTYTSDHLKHLNPAQVAARSLAEDRSGILWIGTATGFFKVSVPKGQYRGAPHFTNFKLPASGPDPNQSSNVRSIFEESPGVFWIGVFNGGLFRLDLGRGALMPITGPPDGAGSLRASNVYALYGDPGDGWLYIGHEQGIDRLYLPGVDPGRPGSARFEAVTDDHGRLNSRINAIEPAGNGRLWIGTGSQGLLLLDTAGRQVVRQYLPGDGEPAALPYSFINAIFTDRRGHTWVAPNMGGCCRMTTQGDNAARFDCFLDGLYIVDFHEDRNGKIWMAAMNYGLVVFDPTADSWELVTMDNHLLRNTATGIQEDSLGRLWFTSLGLGRYDPGKDTYQHFGYADGITDLDPERCFFRSSSGVFFYCSVGGGIQVFQPEAVTDNPFTPQIVLTSFRLFNEAATVKGGTIMDTNIEVAEEVRLAHYQHSFTIQFAGLEFTAPEKNQYKYRLEGFDDGWIYAGFHREARYTNVPPGRYTFLVDAANNNGVWSNRPARLTIAIAHPWWTTPVAWGAYFLLAGMALTVAYRLQRHRWRLQARLENEHKEALRLKELDAFKSNLYTNVTHEFRTPLTVISGIAGQLPAFYRQQATARFERGVEVIHRNAGNLLNLVNQLLDLAKLEMGNISIHMKQGDVVPFLGQLCDSFESLASQKNIRIHFQAETNSLIMDYDADKLQKIVGNLLSNAIKFTPENGQVALSVKGVFSDWEEGEGGPAPSERLLLSIRDTGIGIPSDQLPFIFDRFYQVERSSTRRWEGTGIGLTLTKELVELLGGNIGVESRPGEGSTFTVSLPVTQWAAPREEAARGAATASSMEWQEMPPSESIQPTKKDPESPLILIVEDNRDISSFLKSCLDHTYRVAEAGNGRQGIEMARQLVPDLIISDVMMPEEDGYQLCRTLKTEESTSHIPIILLTARIGEEDRLEGFRQGADAYLPKPFQYDELLVRIAKLIELRQRLRERYASGQPPADQHKTPEDKFIRKIRELVEKHLDDPGFGVKELAEGLNLHRTQLHRKITFLTGEPAFQFIRNVRLRKAREMLQTEDMSVAEIAFAVGFRDPSYFTRVFTQTFGYPPSHNRSKP